MFREGLLNIPQVVWEAVIGTALGTLIFKIGQKETDHNNDSTPEPPEFEHPTRRKRTVRPPTRHRTTSITRLR